MEDLKKDYSGIEENMTLAVTDSDSLPEVVSEKEKMTKKIYKEQNGEKIKVAAVHAGLECGTFQTLNPNLDMISIGPDIAGAHTINETLYLDSIPKVWTLLKGLLIRIGE